MLTLTSSRAFYPRTRWSYPYPPRSRRPLGRCPTSSGSGSSSASDSSSASSWCRRASSSGRIPSPGTPAPPPPWPERPFCSCSWPGTWSRVRTWRQQRDSSPSWRTGAVWWTSWPGGRRRCRSRPSCVSRGGSNAWSRPHSGRCLWIGSCNENRKRGK